MAEPTPEVHPIDYHPGGPAPATVHSLGVLAVKILGLYCLVQSLTLLSYFIAVVTRPAFFTLSEIVVALPAALYIIAGLLLILKAGWFVDRVLRISAHEAIAGVSIGEELHAMAFSVAGVIVLVWGLEGVAQQIAQAVALEGLRSTGMVTGGFALNALTGPVIEVIAGLVLFLRGRGIAALWRRLRTAGLEESGSD